MVKRTIKETIREYDEDGHLTRETVTETTEDDDNVYSPYYVFPPSSAPDTIRPWCGEPIYTCNTSEIKQQGSECQ